MLNGADADCEKARAGICNAGQAVSFSFPMQCDPVVLRERRLLVAGIAKMERQQQQQRAEQAERADNKCWTIVVVTGSSQRVGWFTLQSQRYKLTGV